MLNYVAPKLALVQCSKLKTGPTCFFEKLEDKVLALFAGSFIFDIRGGLVSGG
jgi:hypothetical protein